MAVPESVVEQVVRDVSNQMQDPNFVQLSVGVFVEAQPQISRFLSAKATRLGGAQSLVHLVFHAQVLLECLRRHLGRELSEVTFGQLDEASQAKDFPEAFAAQEPHLASYVASNVEDEKLKSELCRVGLALALTR